MARLKPHVRGEEAIRRAESFSRDAVIAEQVFTNPRQAAAYVRRLVARGAVPTGRLAVRAAAGIQPHHTVPRVSHSEGKLMAETTDRPMGPVEITRRPAPTSNPDPEKARTAADGYDPVTQRLLVEWKDGGTPYYYYDVPPQVAEAYRAAPSPGRFINLVLNHFQYGPVA